MLDVSDLPPQIVPAVEALARRLAAHVRQHREATLDVHEQGVLKALRAEGAALLAGVAVVVRKLIPLRLSLWERPASSARRVRDGR